MSQRILILGALSAVAEQCARLHAAAGDRLVLVARHAERLEQVAQDLRVRGAADVVVEALDLAGDVNHAALVNAWAAKLGGLDRVYLFYGALGDQKQAETDLAGAREAIEVNFTSQALWSLAAANVLEAQNSGALVIVSSVAGDRGRQSNYVYGAAKGAMSLLGQGIAHRLAKTGARAVVVKLGFVISPMTAGMKRGGPLWTSAETAGALVKRAGDSSGPIVYAPWFWRFVMLIIRAVPAFVFHKTKL